MAKEIMNEDYLGRLYRRLVGATVMGFRWDDEFPVFTVRMANGQRREIGVQQDAEGNGPGFIAGLED
jgi:hypothetical protein